MASRVVPVTSNRNGKNGTASASGARAFRLVPRSGAAQFPAQVAVDGPILDVPDGNFLGLPPKAQNLEVLAQPSPLPALETAIAGTLVSPVDDSWYVVLAQSEDDAFSAAAPPSPFQTVFRRRGSWGVAPAANSRSPVLDLRAFRQVEFYIRTFAGSSVNLVVYTPVDDAVALDGFNAAYNVGAGPAEGRAVWGAGLDGASANGAFAGMLPPYVVLSVVGGIATDVELLVRGRR